MRVACRVNLTRGTLCGGIRGTRACTITTLVARRDSFRIARVTSQFPRENPNVKHVIAALFAGSLALSSMSVLAADAATDTTQPKAETKTEKTKEYVKQKAHNTKVKTKKAAKKAKDTVANRKTTDPASPSENRPEAPK